MGRKPLFIQYSVTSWRHVSLTGDEEEWSGNGLGRDEPEEYHNPKFSSKIIRQDHRQPWNVHLTEYHIKLVDIIIGMETDRTKDLIINKRFKDLN